MTPSADPHRSKTLRSRECLRVNFRLFSSRSEAVINAVIGSYIDGVGHCQLHLMVEGDYDRRDAAERVEMFCAFEPAALDQFVEQMRELISSLTGSVVLAPL